MGRTQLTNFGRIDASDLLPTIVIEEPRQLFTLDGSPATLLPGEYRVVEITNSAGRIPANGNRKKFVDLVAKEEDFYSGPCLGWLEVRAHDPIRVITS